MIRFNTPISTKKNPDTSVPIVPPISWKCGNSSLAYFTDTPKKTAIKNTTDECPIEK